MKKLLTFLVIFFSLNINAQTNVYHPFPDSNAVWRVNSYVGCLVSYFSGGRSYYQYTMGGDTIMGAYTYKKIYQSGMFSYCPYPNDTLSNYEYHFAGGLRQDTANKKVYFKFPSCSDILFYDFSKHVGDTLNTINYNSSSGGCPTFGYTVTITSIDSVLIGNSYHKQFHLFNSYNYPIGNLHTLIEGVGFTSGLLESVYVGPPYRADLICFSHNSDIYPDTVSSCNLITGISSYNTQNSPPHIYPNPANNKIIIDANDVVEVKLFDVLGKQITSTKATDVDVSNLNEGVYFIQVQTRQNTTTQKIVVQH